MRFLLSLVVSLIAVSAQSESVQLLMVDHKSQSDLSLTVYNDFALVRDSRDVVLPEGELLLEFEEVAQTLVPSSVAVASAGASEVEVLEQSYRYDLLNRQSLLETYIGRKLKYSRTVLQGQTYEKVLREGILLSTNPEIVDFGDEIEISPEGVISLPDVPDGLTLSPTLVWRLRNERTGEQQLTTTYVANQISWHADYVLSLNEKRNTLDMTSWATVKNDSGTIFENTSIRLIAGDVGRVISAVPRPQARMMMAMESADASSIQSSETNAYHAYDLPNRTTLINHEAKQLKFIGAERVPYKQSYRVASAAAAYPLSESQRPGVISEISFRNDRGNRLGKALAAGVARVYLDSERTPDLVGETQMPATPVGEQVRLSLGQSFDVTAKRSQTDFARLNDRTVEVSYEVEVKNAKSKDIRVEIQENMQGDWQILESSHALKKTNNMATAEIEVRAGGSETFTYRVRVRF